MGTTNKCLIYQFEKTYDVSLQFYILSTGCWCDIQSNKSPNVKHTLNVYDEGVESIIDKKFFIRLFLEETIQTYFD